MSEVANTSKSAKQILDTDYINEPTGLKGVIYSILKKMTPKSPDQTMDAFLATIDDATFSGAINAAREKVKVRTIEERLLDPRSAQKRRDLEEHRAIVEWVKNNPLVVERQNALVHTINTTGSVQEFKEAVNKMMEFMDRKPVFVVGENGPKPPANPASVGPAAIALEQ